VEMVERVMKNMPHTMLFMLEQVIY